jgi:hypothetical protein
VRLVMRLVTIRASAVGVFAGMAGATLVLVAFLLGHWVGTADGAYRAAFPVVPAPMVVPPLPAPAQPSDPSSP